MNSVWLLTKKNLKLLVRAKASALIVIFAPLLIILILGISYNTSSTFGLNIGVYSPSFTDDVNSFINILQQEEFKIVKYEKSIDECIEDIKLGFVHTCIDVPESLKIDGNSAKEITFYLDPSKVNLVYMIQETLKTKFDFKAQEISQALTQNVLSKLSETKTSLDTGNSQLNGAKEKSASASGTLSSAQTSLSGLDFSVPTSTYNTTIVNEADAEISSSLSKVSSAISAVQSSNLNATEKAEIKGELEDAQQKLNKAASFFSGANTTSIITMVNSLQTDLDSVKVKLTSISENVNNAASSLGTAGTTVSEINSALDSAITTITNAQSNLNSLQVTDPSVITTPLITKVEKVGKEGTYLNYLFPILLVLVVMFASLLLGTTLVMMEKNSPAFLRNYFLPLRKITFILSTYLTTLILIIIQVSIILAVSLGFMNESVGPIPLMFLVLLIASSVFTFLGMGLGYLFNSEETAVLASISVGSLLLFVSGVILPLESVSPLLRDITFFNPYVIAEKLVKEIFIFKAPFSALWIDLLTLIGYAVVLLMVILIAESLLHKHLVNKFMKHHHKLHRQTDKQNKNDV